MLDAEAPGLLLRDLIQAANRDVTQRLTQHRGRPQAAAGCGLDSEREWIPQKLEREPGRRRYVADPRRDRVVAQEPSGDRVAHHAHVRWVVIDAITAAKGCPFED